MWKCHIVNMTVIHTSRLQKRNKVFLFMLLMIILFFPWIKKKVKPSSQDWLIASSAYPGFYSMKWLEVFLFSPGWGASPLQVTSPQLVRFPQQFAGTHLYTWVERGTVRVKCLAQEHNTMSLARARTRTACYGVERTNHEATVPPLNRVSFFGFGP